MTLRARLFLTFILLSLFPVAVLTAFTLDRLNRSLALWNTPGVDQALESALQVSKTAYARLDATARAQVTDWALALPPRPFTTARRTAVRAGLEASGLDFLQLYVRAHGRWLLVEEVLPEGILAPEPIDLAPDLDQALATGSTIHSPHGALAAAARIEVESANAGEWALTAGMRVPSDFFARVGQVERGVAFYHRFGILREVSRTYWLLLVAAMVVGLVVISLVVSTTLANAMTHPLRQLEVALEQVAAGNLETRVRPAGAREIRLLGERFNAMTGRLSAARSALAQAEREAAWREVARRLAHEFKNILTPMGLSLHRMQRRAEQVPPEQREAVSESLAALDLAIADLTHLTGQFSQYARLPEPRFETVDLDDIVREVVRLNPTGRWEVQLEPAETRLPVRADRLLLSRAVHNLLLNACEASPEGGRVEVRTLGEDGVASVEILDRGEGLPSEVRARLFEPYVSTRSRGSGLGLSLVRDIALQHGGSVTLEDRDGGGARACLTLPLLEPASRA